MIPSYLLSYSFKSIADGAFLVGPAAIYLLFFDASLLSVFRFYKLFDGLGALLSLLTVTHWLLLSYVMTGYKPE